MQLRHIPLIQMQFLSQVLRQLLYLCTKDKVRKNLQMALGGHRISSLEKAIKDFEVAKLKDTNGYLRKAKLKLEKLRKEREII